MSFLIIKPANPYKRVYFKISEIFWILSIILIQFLDFRNLRKFGEKFQKSLLDMAQQNLKNKPCYRDLNMFKQDITSTIVQYQNFEVG